MCFFGGLQGVGIGDCKPLLLTTWQITGETIWGSCPCFSPSCLLSPEKPAYHLTQTQSPLKQFVDPHTSVLSMHKAMVSRYCTQASCRSHHSIKSWCDAVCPGPAPVPEDDPVMMVICQLLYSNPNHPTGHGSNSHAGNEEAWRDLE